MDAVRLAPPPRSVTRPKLSPDAVRVVVEWAVFAVTAVVFAQTLRGHMRYASLAVLVLAPVAAATFRFRPWRELLRLAAFPLLFAAGLLLLRQFPSNPFGQWLARGFMLAGSGFAVLGWVPAALRARIRNLFDHLTARPSGVAAHVFAAVGVAVPACVLFLSAECQRLSGDTIAVVATIEREWNAGTRDLTPYAAHPRQGRWVTFESQDPPYNLRPTEYTPGLYSAYPAGMEVFAWPVALAELAAGADLADDAVQARVEYRTAAGLAALALALFFLAALCITDARSAFAVTAALAVGSAFLTTFGHLLWQQAGVAFWGLVVLLFELRSGGRVGWRGVVVQGVACGLMLACRTSAVTFLLPYGVWVLARDWRRGLLVPVAAAVAYAPFAVVYWHLFHSPVGPSHTLTAGLRWPTWESAAGVLVSPARGLFVYQPILLLLPLALAAHFRSRSAPSGFYPFALTAAGLQVLLAASWFMWWGGHCNGSRLVSEAVPVLALAVAPAVGRLLRSPIGRVAFAVLAVGGLMAHHNLAYHFGSTVWNVDPADVDFDTGRLWDWTRPPFLYLPGKS